MVSVSQDFPYISSLSEQFKGLLERPLAFKVAQRELLKSQVDFIEGGSKYTVSITLEAQGEIQTVGMLCDDASALASEFRAIFHSYLGDTDPLYNLVEKRFNECLEGIGLDAVSYLVLVDKTTYWNVFVTVTSGGQDEAV